MGWEAFTSYSTELPTVYGKKFVALEVFIPIGTGELSSEARLRQTGVWKYNIVLPTVPELPMESQRPVVNRSTKPVYIRRVE